MTMFYNLIEILVAAHLWVIPCKASSCFKGSCYFKGTEAVSWSDAHLYCEENHGELTSIHSSAETRFTHDLFGEGWIALTGVTNGDVLIWIDGYPEHLRDLSSNDDCACLYPHDRRRNDNEVGEPTLHYPICKFLPSCYKGSCYIRGPEALSWSESSQYCKTINGVLTSVHSEEHNQYLLSHFRGGWIGLTDAAEENAWEWIDGSPVNYTNWATPPDNLFENEHYARMLQDGKWIDNEDCIREHPICDVGKNTYCYKGFCFFRGDRIPRYNATLQCTEMGGALPSIHSEEENEFLFGLFNKHGWLGLAYEGESVWKWLDGTELDYVNWDDVCPRDHQPHKESVLMKEGGRWRDVPGLRNRNTFCKVPMGCRNPLLS